MSANFFVFRLQSYNNFLISTRIGTKKSPLMQNINGEVALLPQLGQYSCEAHQIFRLMPAKKVRGVAGP